MNKAEQKEFKEKYKNTPCSKGYYHESTSSHDGICNCDPDAPHASTQDPTFIRKHPKGD